MKSFIFLIKFLFLIILQFNCLNAGQSNSKSKLLRFESEPESIYTELNKKVHLKCLARPKKAKIQWLINEEPVRIDEKAIFTTIDSLIIQLPESIDQNVGVYTFDEIIKSDIQCRAEYRNQVLLSAPAKIIVAFINDFPLNDEEIKIDVKEKQIAVIPCKPPNSPPKVVTSFAFQNKLIESNDDKYHLMPSGNLQIFNVSVEDSGKYQCFAYNPWLKERKNSSNFVTLHVEKQFLNLDELNNDKFAIEKLEFLSTPKQKYSVIRGTELQIFECVASSILPVNITWYREDRKPLPKNRFKIVGGNLILSNIQTIDKGIYICEATNGHKTITANSALEVKQTSNIKTDLESKIVQINDQVEFECSVNGFPIPNITWYLNGVKLTNLNAEQNDIKIELLKEDTSKLTIKKANELHSGIIQCFASNDLLTTYSSAKLDVVNDISGNDLSLLSTNSNSSISNKVNRTKIRTNKNRNRNKSSNQDLSVIGKPKIIRLSSDSVIVHWKMPKQSKSPITFFKIQYKDSHQFNQTIDWITVEDDIPPNINSYSITQLQSDRLYKFRIMAVYKNQDSQDGKVSDGFFLAKNPVHKRPITVPQITQSKSDSSNSIDIFWECSSAAIDDQYDGFLIHYRPTQSAEMYHKITIDNNKTKEYTITDLSQSKQYDIRMQTFNLGGVSDFSKIETVRTLPALGGDDLNQPEEETEIFETPDNDPNLPPFHHPEVIEDQKKVESPSSSSTSSTSSSSSTPSTSTTTKPSSISEQPNNKIDSNESTLSNDNQEDSKIDPLSTQSPLFYVLISVILLIIIIIIVYCYILIKRLSSRKSKKSNKNNKFDLLDDENFFLKSAEDDSLSRGFTAKMNSFEPIYSNGGVLSSNPHLTKKAIKNYNHNYATIGGRKNDVYDSSSVNVRINKFCDDNTITNSLLAINKTSNQINKHDLPNRQSTISHYNLTRSNQPNFATQQISSINFNNIHNKNLLMPETKTTQTLGRPQRQQRNFEDLYGTNTQFATINRSNSMARLNGTLERNRRRTVSKNDLFSVLNIKEENEDLLQQQQQPQYRISNNIKSVRYVNNNLLNGNLNNSEYSTALNNDSLNSNISSTNVMNSTMNNYDLQNLQNSPRSAYNSTILTHQPILNQQQQQQNLMTNLTTSNNNSNNRQFGMMQSSC